MASKYLTNSLFINYKLLKTLTKQNSFNFKNSVRQLLKLFNKMHFIIILIIKLSKLL